MGVRFLCELIYNNNTLSLGIAASWNKTWYYNPIISAAFSSLGMKDRGRSRSDGDDGYIALYMVLPCVAIISVLIVSFLVLVLSLATIGGYVKCNPPDRSTSDYV